MKDHRCRVCLNEQGIMSSLFQKNNNPMISTKIMSIAKVRIYPGDGLPAVICSYCTSKLNRCIEFIRLCESTDSRLRSSISSVKVETNILDIETFNRNPSDDEFTPLKIESSEELQVEVANNVMKELKDLRNTSSRITNNGKKISHKKKEIKLKQQCNICGRVMSSRHRLKTHLVTHTGERPFKCSFCDKNFSLEANLKVHMRVHTGEKPFRCSVCGELFAQSSGLIAHKRKHTGQLPYKCMLCPRSFRTIGHLQYHTKRHTGEKKFECDKCTRAFITRGDLNQHLATHSGDRAHVCSVCGLRLTRASNLKRHMQQLHNGTRLEDTRTVNEPGFEQREQEETHTIPI